MEMDGENDGNAVGQFLWIKVMLDIRKPLVRGIMMTVQAGGKEKESWFPFVYEFLPDFCYTCGIIGHTDKLCGKKLEKGEKQQFIKALRFIPEEKRGGESFLGWRASSRSNYQWRQGASSGLWRSGELRNQATNRFLSSNDENWRKPIDAGGSESNLGRGITQGSETLKNTQLAASLVKQVSKGKEGKEGEVEMVLKEQGDVNNKEVAEENEKKKAEIDMNSAMHVDKIVKDGEKIEKEVEMNKGPRRTFKHHHRAKHEGKEQLDDDTVGKKEKAA